jgi:hypothetical protein
MSRREWNKTARIVEEAREILSAEYPVTLRQCFYRLVSREVIQNSRRDYQMLSRILTKARNDGRIDFEWLVDRSRPVYARQGWKDPAEYAKTVARAYHKDYWETQPNYVEIWTEKDSIIGSIEAVTDELGVTVRVGRGFLSTTRAHEIAEHFVSIDKPIYVFYLGDFDPSGVAIEADASTRIRSHGAFFKIERLAIEQSDIDEFNLPPLRVKDSDTRSASFRRKHGEECVELDALPVEELRRRIREAVSDCMDEELWNRAIAVEKVELASIIDGMKGWNNLPKIDLPTESAGGGC